MTRLSAAGRAMADQSVQLDQAGVQIDIGTEQVIATLAEPVADAFRTNSLEAKHADVRIRSGMAGSCKELY